MPYRTLLISAAALVAACGPIEYTSMIMKADTALEKAERMGAPKYAPLEYWRAKAYFDKAREETGRNDYDFAIDYATQAYRDAKKAQDIVDEKKEKERKAAKEKANVPAPAPGPASAPGTPPR
ncbi:MAG: DUF4398 domain-containing protein [Deltaproteobacteria bacterium]|nr:DUF4398 domain-containing protein [Deltaproteobacteria bacterium]